MKRKDEIVTVEILDQAVDAILSDMDRMFIEQGKRREKKHTELEKEIRELKHQIKKGFEKLEESFEALKSKVNKLSLQ